MAVEVDGRLLAEADPGWSLDITPNPWPALVVRLGSAGFAERARRKLGITDPAALANYDFAGTSARQGATAGAPLRARQCSGSSGCSRKTMWSSVPEAATPSHTR